jgi:hypothetical protein
MKKTRLKSKQMFIKNANIQDLNNINPADKNIQLTKTTFDEVFVGFSSTDETKRRIIVDIRET